MKYLAYILFTIIGLGISYWFYYNNSFSSVLFGFWIGYFGHMIINWED